MGFRVLPRNTFRAPRNLRRQVGNASRSKPANSAGVSGCPRFRWRRRFRGPGEFCEGRLLLASTDASPAPLRTAVDSERVGLIIGPREILTRRNQPSPKIAARAQSRLVPQSSAPKLQPLWAPRWSCTNSEPSAPSDYLKCSFTLTPPSHSRFRGNDSEGKWLKPHRWICPDLSASFVLRRKVALSYGVSRRVHRARGAVHANDCVFCKIAAGTIPSTQVYSDGEFYAFRDINPARAYSYPDRPRKHIPRVVDAQADDAALLGRMLLCANVIAAKEGLPDQGCRYVINTGDWAARPYTIFISTSWAGAPSAGLPADEFQSHTNRRLDTAFAPSSATPSSTPCRRACTTPHSKRRA